MPQADQDTQHPSPVLETDLTTCWHRTNTSFDLPKGVVILLISSPEAYVSPEAHVLGRLLSDIVEDQLNEVAYDAQLAGGQALARCMLCTCMHDVFD